LAQATQNTIRGSLLMNRVLDRRQDAIRELDIVDEILFGISAGNFPTLPRKAMDVLEIAR